MSKEARYLDKKTTDDGNVQYVYGPRQIQNRHKRKAEKVLHLSKKVPELRKQVRRDFLKKDPRKKLTALAVSLIDETYERVGNPESAEKGHFGVTGWCKKHVKFGKGKATLSYVGKSGVEQVKEVTSSPVLKVLKEACKGKKDSDSLFTYQDDSGAEKSITSRDVNLYLLPYQVTAKDLRGFHANREVAHKLREAKAPEGVSKKEVQDYRKNLFKEALEAASSVLGHTVGVLRNQYLIPGMEDEFLKNGQIPAGVKLATKSEPEKEDEQARDMLLRNPKIKPSREDRRKRRLKIEDPDLEPEPK